VAIAPDGTIELDPIHFELLKKHYGREV